uniref:Aminotransferase-like plant mobile domain-containing protein n=1 Tax=Oryza rufipogon TaxID=4529 RepID=A0A0E0MX03_ORYRU
MAADADEETPLVEESTAAIISCAGAGAAAVARSARFLLPRAGATAAALPGCPPCAGPVLGDGHRVEFHGWPCSSALWRRWVERLRPRHEPLWREVGILDAVLATAAACRVRRDGGLVLQLAAFWCGATSSFAFPWGEATVTLEDVAVLGGLPLLGAPVTARLPGTLAGDVAALEAVRAALHRSKCKNSTYSTWLHHFLGRDGGDGDGEDAEAEAQSLLEHGAFLATWLSLYVLPAGAAAVRPQVFPLAARLARGQSVALASIYNDLTALKRHLASSTKWRHPFVAWAPLHVVQLWAWERFPELRPDKAATSAHATADGHGAPPPWAARWHNARTELQPAHIHAVLMSPMEFEWRPYGSSGFALQLDKAGIWIHGRDIVRSRELLSFAHCLRPYELVGLRCVEHYLPHRVTRQLGFDQDVPGNVPRASSNSSVAWATYKMEPQDVKFTLPRHEPGVTVEYAQWWEPYSSACAAAVANAAKMKQLDGVDCPRKRNAEGFVDGDSGKRRHLEIAEDPEDEIPLIDRQNSITMTVNGSSNHVEIVGIGKDSMASWARNGGNGSPLHKSTQQALSDAEAVLETTVGEDEASDYVITEDKKNSKVCCLVEDATSDDSNKAIGPAASVTRKSIPKDVVVISDDEFDEELSSKDDEKNTIYLSSNTMETTKCTLQALDVKREVVITGNGEQGSPLLKEVRVHSKCYDIIEINDDESIEVTRKEDEAIAMHVNSDPMETTKCTLQELDVKREVVITGNGEQSSPLLKEVRVQSKCYDIIEIDDESGEVTSKGEEAITMHLNSPMLDKIASTLREANEESKPGNTSDKRENSVLKDIMPRNNCDSEDATVLNDITLRKELAEVTHISSAQINVDTSEASTKEMRACITSGEADKRGKLNKKRLAALEGDEKENEDMSVSNQEIGSHMDCQEVNKKGNNESSSSILVDGNADHVKKTVSTKTPCKNADQEGFHQSREVGMEEMVRGASEAQQAQKAQLEAAIDGLKEEIAMLERQVRDTNPRKA